MTFVHPGRLSSKYYGILFSDGVRLVMFSNPVLDMPVGTVPQNQNGNQNDEIHACYLPLTQEKIQRICSRNQIATFNDIGLNQTTDSNYTFDCTNQTRLTVLPILTKLTLRIKLPILTIHSTILTKLLVPLTLPKKFGVICLFL